jgi:hypothetical protein
LKQKGHLENALLLAVYNFPENKEVKEFIEKYEDVFRVCVDFKGGKESVETDQDDETQDETSETETDVEVCYVFIIAYYC